MKPKLHPAFFIAMIQSMVNEILSTLLTYLEDPKKRIWAVVTLLILVAIWFGHDQYTQNTSLNHIEKVIGVVERIGELDRNNTFQNSDIEYSREWMIAELKSYTNYSTSPTFSANSPPSDTFFSLSTAKRIMLGSWPFIILLPLVFTAIFNKQKKSNEAWAILGGILIFAIPAGTLVHFLAPSNASTGSIAIIGAILPILVFVLIGVFLPALGAARRTARQMQDTTQARSIFQAMETYRDVHAGTSIIRIEDLILNNLLDIDMILATYSNANPDDYKKLQTAAEKKSWIQLHSNFAIVPNKSDKSGNESISIVSDFKENKKGAIVYGDGTAKIMTDIEEANKLIQEQCDMRIAELFISQINHA